MEQGKRPAAGEFYRHFKGNLYQVIGIAKHSETDEKMVVYQALYGDYALYVRPLHEFMSLVDKEKYPRTGQKYRFERVMPGEKSEAGEKQGGETKEALTSQEGREEQVREEILQFLDAEGAAEKLEVLHSIRKKMDENLITTIELSMDLLPDEKESLERRYELIEQNLEKRIRFEGGRLR